MRWRFPSPQSSARVCVASLQHQNRCTCLQHRRHSKCTFACFIPAIISGEEALTAFPDRRQDIQRVLDDQSFTISDLRWIVEITHQTVRVTVSPETYPRLRQVCPDIPSDMIFGGGERVSLHLMFSWQQSVCGSHCFGHYDLLCPSGTAGGTLLLVADVICLYIGKQCSFIYIYIYGFNIKYSIYIY